MYYYKVKKDVYDYFNHYAFVKDELLTEKEREIKARYISDDCFDLIDWKRTNTFNSFGVRFQCSEIEHTNQEDTFIWEYNKSSYTSIIQCYSSPSVAKQKAEDHCRECCYVLNGYDFRIISYNTWSFSCAYKYDNKRTGYVHLVVHTGYNVYDFPLSRIK